MKPKLLVLELWALGDLALASPFLQAAVKRYDVTLLGKSTARELQPWFWPEVKVVEFSLPWTAFRRKYALHQWPWRGLSNLVGGLRAEHFDVAISARWDPRDHFLMFLTGARKRVGFSRLGSFIFLSTALPHPGVEAHRYEYWRRAAEVLDIPLPEKTPYRNTSCRDGLVAIHCGAGQKTRVWPLERYAVIVNHLRKMGLKPKIICDANQVSWWKAHGEEAAVPSSLEELILMLKKASLFVGNDSGPGHLAASLGVPTFTIFGNQVPSRFSPLNEKSRWVEGHACQFKPCYDDCHFSEPECLKKVSVEEVMPRLESFVSESFT